MKTGALVLCHEEKMNLEFELMMNKRIHLASGQTKLLGFSRLKELTENIFCEWKRPGKVCRRIRHDLQTGTHKVFLD